MEQYRFADTARVQRFSEQQLADLSFVTAAIRMAWRRFDVDNDPSLLRSNREMLLNYLDAAYSLRRGTDFGAGVDAFTLHCPARSALCKGGAGELFLDMARCRHVDAAAVADRLAHVEGFEQRQLVALGQHQVGEADQDFLAIKG